MQLILALDKNGTEADMSIIKEMFHEFCKQTKVSDYIIIYPQENVRVSMMRNFSLKYADKQFIIFRDDDDISSSINSIIKQCINYGKEWKTNKILKMFSLPLEQSYDGKSYENRNLGMYTMIIPQSMKNYVMNIPTHEGGEDVITICVLLMRGFLQKGHPFSDRAYDSSNIETLHDVISGKATIDLNQNIIKYTTGKERRFIMHSDSAGDIAAEYIIKIIKLYNRYLYEMTPEDYRKGMIGISTMIDNIFKFETSDSFADIKTFMYMYAEESRSMNINNYKNNIEAIRMQYIMDIFIPDNKFVIASPNAFSYGNVKSPISMNPISDNMEYDNTYRYQSIMAGVENIIPFTVTEEEAKKNLTRYIHPDEQRIVNLEYPDKHRTQDVQWVEYKDKERKTPLFSSHDDINAYNYKIKHDPISMLHGGEIKTMIINILIVLIIVVIIVIVVVYYTQYGYIKNLIPIHAHI